MIAHAASEGIVVDAGSGYRSYDAQKSLYDNYVKQDGQAKADTYSARPGFSEHQTGLAVDFAPIEDSFASSAPYDWLVFNAHKFGFVLRYPHDKTDVTGYMYEPWHWRYIGIDDATDMKAKGVKTLEEYYNVPGGKYADQEVPTNPDTPKDPAPTDEAAKSATEFVARVASQVAAAAIIVNGLAGLVKQYANITFDNGLLGIATIATAVGLVAYGQYRYKKSGGSKGWFF